MFSSILTYYLYILLLIFGKVQNDCFHLINGVAVYTGTTSVTYSGRTCQRWDSQVPHPHSYCCDKVTSADENYCRNPDDWFLPWCMTSDPFIEWEECVLPICDDTTTTTATTASTTALTTATIVTELTSVPTIPQTTTAATSEKPLTTSAPESTISKTITQKPSATTTETPLTTTAPELTTRGTITQKPTATTNENLLTTTVPSLTRGHTTSKTTAATTATESITGSITTKPITEITTTRFATTTTKPGSNAYRHGASTTPSGLCECPCSDRKLLWLNFYHGNLTDEEKRQILFHETERLRTEILVDANFLSSSRRQKQSASDQRTSAASIGGVGVAILVVIFSSIVINDIITFCVQVHSACRSKHI